MQNILFAISFFTLFSCASNPEGGSNSVRESSNPLVSRWELMKEYYEGQEVLNRSDISSANVKRNFLQFNEDGSALASVWVDYEGGAVSGQDVGLYELDNPTGRIRIEIDHGDLPNLHSGSFRWEIKKKELFLHFTNQRSGTYRVYLRSDNLKE